MNFVKSNDKPAAEQSSNASGVQSLKDTGFLVPPQEDKIVSDSNTKSAASWLAPPQEEKVDIAGARKEKSRIDQAVDRFTDIIGQYDIVNDASNDLAEESVNRGAVLSGAAGVTGEDLGRFDKQKLVRRNT